MGTPDQTGFCDRPARRGVCSGGLGGATLFPVGTTQAPGYRLAAALGITLVLGSSGCRPDPEWGLGPDEEWVTIYQVQMEHPDDQHPELGSQVAFRSVVVTAYDTHPEIKFDDKQDGDEIICIESVGYTGGLVVQEVGGGPNSGIPLFNPAIVPQFDRLGPGDLVDVRGEYLEFCLAGEDNHPDSYCGGRNTNRLTQLGGATATKVGEVAAPVPIDLTLQDVSNAQSAEPYEGVLVRIVQRLQISPCDNPGVNCCGGDYDMYGNLCAGGRFEDGRCNGGIELTNEFYTLPQGTTCVMAVQGILTWFGHESRFGEYRLSPRGPEDVTIPTECLASGM